MKALNKKQSYLTCVVCTAFLIFGCSSDDVAVDIIDNIDTEYHAKISYINTLESSLTFYTKSTVYPNSVYDNQHRITEVMSTNVSNEIQHDWINGANETKVAYEKSISGTDRTSDTFDLTNNKSYWAIAWQHDQSNKLSLIAKSTTNQANYYTVRVFTNADLQITLNQLVDVVPATEAGLVTPSFPVEMCSDLVIGAHPIDLCQSANFGGSYLVVLNENTGAYIIAEE